MSSYEEDSYGTEEESYEGSEYGSGSGYGSEMSERSALVRTRN